MTLKKRFICLYCIFLAFNLLQIPSVYAQHNFKSVDNWMKDNIKVLGGRAVLLLYKDGKIIYSNQVNEMTGRQKALIKMVAKRKGKDAQQILNDYDENSVIAIASCSKWLTAALVMTFVDEGKLDIHDTIGKFLPVMSGYGKGNITILDCLSHMTGIKTGNLKESREIIADAASMEESIAKIARMPMEATPGTSFHYSSSGLQIAAAVIEKISGKDFKTLFEERIAKPCNMLYTNWGLKKVPLVAGGAKSTATDYMNFLVMILNKGTFNGHQVLKASSVNLMQINYVEGKKIISSPNNASDFGYGFGEWVMKDTSGNPSDAVTSPGLFGSFPWVDNKNKYAGVLFTFNFKNKGRGELYKSLKQVVDAALPL